MLQILAVSSLRSMLTGRRASLTLEDVPRVAREELGLFGVAVPTDALVGASLATLDALRHAADKASCPALLLYEPAPLRLIDPRRREEAIQRVSKVLYAADRLGCSAAGVSIFAPDTDAAFGEAVDSVRRAMESADRLGINLLIRPAEGLTSTPDRVTELIKRVGGFRLGTLPDFESASATGELEHHLRRLAPYAPVVLAATSGFSESGRHAAYDLEPAVRALVEIGYDATLAIDYRGAGDPKEGVMRTRDELDRIFEEARA